MVFTVPATMFDKDKDGVSIAKHKKDIVFEVTISSDIAVAREPGPEKFQATLLSGDLFGRNPLAIGRPSESIAGALNSLLRLTMAELGLKKMRKMDAQEERREGFIDKKFL